MNYYSKIDLIERKRAFDTMAYSWAKTKGYKLFFDVMPGTEIPRYTFSKGELKFITAMLFEEPTEIYTLFNDVIKEVEKELEPNKYTEELDKLITGLELKWTHHGPKPLATNCKSTLTSSGIEIRGDVMDEFWKEFEGYRRNDCLMTFNLYQKLPFAITNVIFNYPATIVFWTDGTKTVVKCQGDDVYDPEKGLAMAISKKALGNKRDYYHTFLKCLKKYKRPTPLKCKSKDALVQKAYACLVKDNDHDAAVGYLGEYLDD